MKTLIVFLRRLIFVSVLIVLAIGLSLFVNKPVPEPVGPADYTFTLGTPYQVKTGLYNVPDTATRIVVVGDSRYLYFSADVNGYRAKVAADDTKLVLGEPELITKPNGETNPSLAVQRYNAVGSTLVRPDGSVCVFTHSEYWTNGKSFPFAAEIQVLCDGSRLQKVVLRGASGTTVLPDRVSGVGQPCTLTIEDEVYVYYTDWDSGLDAIHVAKADVASVENAASWKKYKNGSFSTPGLGGESEPVVRPPTGEDHYAAVCSVSYNTFLQQYIMLFQTEKAVYFTTSHDALVWEKVKRVKDIDLLSGQGYFSFISLNGNSMITSQTGVLVFSNRGSGTLDTMYAQPITLSELKK